MIRFSLVQINRVAGDIDVEHLAVRTGLQTHARAALELDAVGKLAVLEVELPELVTPDVFVQAVGDLAAAREREADRRRRPERVEVDRLGSKIHASNAHR